MDNYNLVVKGEDQFKLFLKKVPYYWKVLDSSLRYDNKHDHVCLYKESVEVIRLVDKFMDDLRTGCLPQVPELGIDLTLPVERSSLFLSYFNKLKFERKMFDMTCLELGLNWAYFQKFLEEDAVNIRIQSDDIEQVRLNIGDSEVLRNQWLTSKFHYGKAKRLINYFSDLQKDPLYIEEKNKQTQKVVDKINDAFMHFDKLLSIHHEAYILVLDIRFVRIANQAKNESLEQLIEKVCKDRAEIQNTIFKMIPGWLRAYTKLEHDYQNGLKLSFIFILRSFHIDQEDEIVAHLQTLLKKGFGHYDVIDVINGNRFVRKHGNKDAVGRIGIDQLKQVEQFKYWVLSYYFKIDSVAKLIHPQMAFEVNEFFDDLNWEKPEINYQVLPSKISPQPKNLAQVLHEWKVPKGIWDLKHLDKRVADRLLIGQIYYKEFCTEQGLSELYGEWLFQIEVFIETLLHNQYSAFNEMKLANQIHFLNVKDIQTSATQLGQQYLSLVKQVANDPSFWELIQKSGLRTWWFGHEDSLRLWGQVQQILTDLIFYHPVDSAGLGQMNRKLQNLRQATELDKREILEKKYAQCERRQTDTREYLNRVLEQNSWAYRITVEARSSKGSLEQSEFSKLFTEFIRLAKRAKPCYWLSGYVGIWQEKNWMVFPEFTIDVVLFFNDRCQEQLQTVVHDLDQRWISFLDTKAAQTLKLQDAENIKYYGAIKPKILMRSVDGLNTMDNTYHVCLEANDRKMKKIVIEHVIPYFAYRDVFRAPFRQIVPKAFIKGAMPKK
ncbi:hypothetical protein FPL17_09630 [Acinetobacter dispersus]|nr:hypothetical protein FPL17_09630 [Acinetobacter dispersus]